MQSLDSLRKILERNEVVEAAGLLQYWHPVTLSNLLLAVQAARTLHSMKERWPEYERAVLALAHHEGVIDHGEYPEAAVSVIQMAIDFVE